MKKILTLALFIGAALSSCQKQSVSTDAPQNGITLSIQADGTATRGTSTAPTRYVVEIYDTPTYNNLVGTQMVNGTGTFALNLDKTKRYYVLGWADVDGTGIFNTSALKNVVLEDGKNAVEAWSGTGVIEANKADAHFMVLRRCVAKVNLYEKTKMPANSTIKMTVQQPTNYLVNEARHSGATERVETITITNEVTVPNTRLNGEDFFILAPAGSDYVTSLTFETNSNAPFVVGSVPFRANRETGITGSFAGFKNENFSVETSDSWIDDIDKDL